MLRILVTSLVTSLVIAQPGAARADKCRDHIARLAADAGEETAIYWDGTRRELVKGSEASVSTGRVVVYYLAKQPPKTENLGLPAGVQFDDKTAHDDEQGQCGSAVRAWSLKIGDSGVKPERRSNCTSKAPTSIDDYVKEYRSPPCRRFGEQSAASVASEAAQILGQIVVDRASEAAYSLARQRAKTWLKCSAQRKWLPSTCAVLDALRLQDLAMAPDQLRAALASDALGLIDLLTQKPPSGDTPAARYDERAQDPRYTVHKLLEQHVVPVLARSVASLTDHPSEAIIRRLVGRGLDIVKDDVKTKLCTLQHRERILADVAIAFASCKVNDTDCQIMNVVEQIDGECPPERRLGEDELGYAQSIAGHFWQAMTIDNVKGASDGTKRLVAALEGSFEVACMYASAEGGPYRCEIQTDKHAENPLAPSESVAIARGALLAAAMRDGAALGRTLIAAAGRVLPAADNKNVSKGLRVLATLTAYAATYAGSGEPSEAAHKQRTSLLESLTRDMTARTERAGDTIASFGGSLRLMGGRRISQTHMDPSTMEDTRDHAWTPPLALPLGFAIDYLRDREKGGGFHAELGILDLGQYLTWDKGGKVAPPDLASALSPSLTLGYFWGRELPFFAGVTAGYTPSFDFDEDDDTDRKGAINLGVTFGVYVPLFDFN